MTCRLLLALAVEDWDLGQWALIAILVGIIPVYSMAALLKVLHAKRKQTKRKKLCSLLDEQLGTVERIGILEYRLRRLRLYTIVFIAACTAAIALVLCFGGIGHSHQDYAYDGHDHQDYAYDGHYHSYAEHDHHHDGYSSSGHTHYEYSEDGHRHR